MRQLVIKSDNAAEDKAALTIIHDEMKYGDSQRITWYTNLGKQIDGWEKVTKEVHNICRDTQDSVYERLASAECVLSDYSDRIKSMETKLSDVLKRVESFLDEDDKNKKKQKKGKYGKDATDMVDIGIGLVD